MPEYPRRGQGVPCVCCLRPDARYTYPVEGERTVVPVCGWCYRALPAEAAVEPTGAPAVVFSEGGLPLATQEVLDRVARKRGRAPDATGYVSTRDQLRARRAEAQAGGNTPCRPRSPNRGTPWRAVGPPEMREQPPSAEGAGGLSPADPRRYTGDALRESIHLSSAKGESARRAQARLEALLSNTLPAVQSALLGRVSRDALAAGLYASHSADLLPEETCAYVASLLEARQVFHEQLEESMNELYESWVGVLKEHAIPLPKIST